MMAFGFSKIIEEKNSNWQLFDSSYLSYQPHSGHAIHKYAIRKNNGGFLIAGDTPSDLGLQLNFLDSSVLRMRLVSQYPTWICEEQAMGKAHIQLSGKNIERRLELETVGTAELILKVFKDQPLSISVENRDQEGCGRAEIFLETPPNHQQLVFAFFAFWFAVSLIFIFAKLNPAPLCFGFLCQLLIVAVAVGYEPLSLTTWYWANGLSLLFIGSLILFGSIRFRVVNLILCGLVLSAYFLFFSSFLVYEYSVGELIRGDAIHAILQTYLSEAWDFLVSQIGLGKIALLALMSVVLVLVFDFFRGEESQPNGLLVGVFFVLMGAVLAINGRVGTPLYELLNKSISAYRFELNMFASLEEKRLSSTQIDLSQTVNDSDQTLVVVIGESANRDHLGIYGYGRDTTPFSEKLIETGSMLKFDFAYSNHTHTNPSLSLALTRADQYGRERWMSAPSILNVANSAGFDTYWISNQQLLGAWDNHVSLIAKEAKMVVSKNKLIGRSRDAKEHDGILVEELQKTLSVKGSSKLIIIHLQGSHASYCSRFPQELAPFNNLPASKAVYGEIAGIIAKTNNGVINCYDNSIHYTDFVLSEIVEALDEAQQPASLLYFSDHSEDVINNKAHNSSVFTYDMAEIPLLIWSNESWRDLYSSRWQNLKENQQKDFTNDHMFETIAGLAGFSSPYISVKNDLSSSEYEELEISTLHGRKKLKDPRNAAYWTRKNFSTLDDASCLKLLPHRVNSLGKAKEALASGACGLEVDVLIEEKDGSYVFQVGHDRNKLSGISLKDFLSNIKRENLKKIWLDVKNLNALNVKYAVSRLNELDGDYDLRTIALIETSFYGAQAALIPESGYRLSYYLPTGKVLQALTQEDDAQSSLAIQIASRVKNMKANEVSFDLRLYPFVKENLESKLSSDVHSYHSWFPSNLVFYTPSLKEEISKREFFRDPKMKTILLIYPSPFSI